jgi:hypothetical protein
MINKINKMPTKEQEKIDDAFTIMITTAILQGFTAGVAFMILFRSR